MKHILIMADGFVFEGEDLPTLEKQADEYMEQLFRTNPKFQIKGVSTEELKSVTKEKPPSLLEMAGNLMKDGIKIARSGFEYCDEETYQHRYNLCLSCEHMPKDGDYKGRCLLCGCWMSGKARFATTKCKLNKW